MKSNSDNFESIQDSAEEMNLGMSDPGKMVYPDQNAGGKVKPTFKTDMSGESGKPTGASFADSLSESVRSMMPSAAPGNGSGALEDNNGQGNSSGIPAAKPIDVLTFGDPNESSLDFRDGSNPNTVTIQGGSTHDHGGPGDIENYGFDKPSMPGGRKGFSKY